MSTPISFSSVNRPLNRSTARRVASVTDLPKPLAHGDEPYGENADALRMAASPNHVPNLGLAEPQRKM
jgi:hypothetical protein